jgi:ParB-like chromosome segregation protein Spo0J
VTTDVQHERPVPVADLGERLAALRLADASALAAMRASLARHGQLSPIRAFDDSGRLEVFDGFKRLRASRALGRRELRVVVVDVDAVEATVHMRELHAGRGLTALEEGWIVRALHRDHRVSQGAIAVRLRCHKSWVCRRLMLVEALEASVQADVRLGLLAPRAAVHVAALPRGNQIVAAGVVIRRGLTVGQTVTLVRELIDAPDGDAERLVLARWSDSRSPAGARRTRAARGAVETITLDMATIRRSAGRLQSCLVTTSIPPGVMRESLLDLGSVLHSLSKTIAAALVRAEVA